MGVIQIKARNENTAETIRKTSKTELLIFKLIIPPYLLI